MALPAIANRKVVTAFLAAPVPLMAPLVVIALAAKHIIDARREGATIGQRSHPIAEASG